MIQTVRANVARNRKGSQEKPLERLGVFGASLCESRSFLNGITQREDPITVSSITQKKQNGAMHFAPPNHYLTLRLLPIGLRGIKCIAPKQNYAKSSWPGQLPYSTSTIKFSSKSAKRQFKQTAGNATSTCKDRKGRDDHPALLKTTTSKLSRITPNGASAIRVL